MADQKSLNIPLLIARLIIVIMAISIFVVGGRIVLDNIKKENEMGKILVGGFISLTGFSYVSYNLVSLASMNSSSYPSIGGSIMF